MVTPRTSRHPETLYLRLQWRSFTVLYLSQRSQGTSVSSLANCQPEGRPHYTKPAGSAHAKTLPNSFLAIKSRVKLSTFDQSNSSVYVSYKEKDQATFSTVLYYSTKSESRLELGSGLIPINCATPAEAYRPQHLKDDALSGSLRVLYDSMDCCVVHFRALN